MTLIYDHISNYQPDISCLSCRLSAFFHKICTHTQVITTWFLFIQQYPLGFPLWFFFMQSILRTVLAWKTVPSMDTSFIYIKHISFQFSAYVLNFQKWFKPTTNPQPTRILRNKCWPISSIETLHWVPSRVLVYTVVPPTDTNSIYT